MLGSRETFARVDRVEEEALGASRKPHRLYTGVGRHAVSWTDLAIDNVEILGTEFGLNADPRAHLRCRTDDPWFETQRRLLRADADQSRRAGEMFEAERQPRGATGQSRTRRSSHQASAIRYFESRAQVRPRPTSNRRQRWMR